MIKIFPADWFKDYIDIDAPIDDMLSEMIKDQSKLDERYTNDSIEFYNSLNEAVNKTEVLSKFQRSAIEVYKNYANTYIYKCNKFVSSFISKIADDMEDFEPYKDKLSRWDVDNKKAIEVSNRKYRYTNIFDNEIPSMDAFNTLKDVSIKVKEIVDFEGSSVDKLKMLETEYRELFNYIKSGKCYSEARGKLLKTNKSISIEKFTTEIFNIFRDGGIVLSEQVSPKEVKETYERFKKYPELLKNLGNERKNVQKGYNAFLKEIKDLDLIALKPYFGKSSKEFDQFYAMYIKLRMDQIVRISQLSDEVFAAKLQAIVDSYIQDKCILIAACGRVKTEDNTKEFIDIVVDEYTEMLIEEEYNSIQIHLALLECLGENTLALNESTLISLDEAAFDNLKNYLINLCKKISDTIGRFVTRIEEYTKMNQRFFEANKDKIVSNVKINETATFTNYYSYSNLMKNLSAVTFKGVNSTELETKAENNMWQTPEDYFKTDGKPVISGFTYNPNGGSIKEQVEDALRGKAKEISSTQINQHVRANLLNYCTNDFQTIKKLTDTDMAALKQFGKAMDTYIATLSNNNGDQVEFNQEVNVKSSSEVQAQNASFGYEETMLTYFNELEIEKDGSPTNGTPNNQAAINKENQKAEANEKKERISKISKAVKSYIKANSQMLSAKMNIATEAYRQSTKILKWYVTEYNKQQGGGDNKNSNTRQNNGNNNETISDAIG